MRRRFFVERFDSQSATLRGDGAEHLGRVLRAELGQQYELSDGERVWLARIERVSLPKRGEPAIEFALVEPIEAREASLQVQLFISLIKFDRFEWCVEKATELGASEIVPLSAARTDKPLLAAAAKRLERWKRIALESAQQARRLRAPVIGTPVRPGEAFAQCAASHKILLSERGDAASLRAAVSSCALAKRASASLALAIGPEGGWTDEEIAAARAHGFVEASLGENILRTETAVIAGLAILQFVLRDQA